MRTPHATRLASANTFALGGDLPIHRLGYGTMRLVGDGAWGEPDPPKTRGEAITLLRRAVDLGITLFDTADAYGPQIAEELLYEALWPYPDTIVIATKGGISRQGPAKAAPLGRPEYLTQCVEMSLRRLKLERIDLYQLHRIDPQVPVAESLGALKRLQEQGKIRHIGLSEVTAAEIEEAQKTVPIVSVQNNYSLTERKSEHTLDYCAQHGIAFLPWYPLAKGRLSQPGSTDGTNHPLDELAKKQNATVTQLALAWLLHRSPVICPIPGTSSLAHLEENQAAASLRISDEDWETIELIVDTQAS